MQNKLLELIKKYKKLIKELEEHYKINSKTPQYDGYQGIPLKETYSSIETLKLVLKDLLNLYECNCKPIMTELLGVNNEK